MGSLDRAGRESALESLQLAKPYKQECKLFIDNYGNTYGFGWNLWEKNYLYIFNINLHNDKQFYYNNDFNEITLLKLDITVSNPLKLFLIIFLSLT